MAANFLESDLFALILILIRQSILPRISAPSTRRRCASHFRCCDKRARKSTSRDEIRLIDRTLTISGAIRHATKTYRETSRRREHPRPHAFRSPLTLSTKAHPTAPHHAHQEKINPSWDGQMAKNLQGTPKMPPLKQPDQQAKCSWFAASRDMKQVCVDSPPSTPSTPQCIVVVPQDQHLLEPYPSGGDIRGCDSAQQTTTSSSASPSPPPSDDRQPNQQQPQQQQQQQQVQQQEGDIQSAGDNPPSPTPLVSKCGHLEVAFAYDAPLRKMSVHILQARGIPARDRGGATHTQPSKKTDNETKVRMILLPSKKQKHKTKIRAGDNPQYMESFLLHRVNPEDVNSMGVRFRVYGCERMRRERLIGEYVVGFAAINLELETTLWLPLEPRASLAHQSSASDLLSLARSDSTGSTHSMQHGGVPELLLGLAYNGTTGRLSAEIVKGSHFRDMALSRAPDTHVRLCLVSSSGQELAHSKTSVRRSQPNPLFKEFFYLTC
ncbi:hypothetical protein J437_LFUL010260 [Ladona fulva]|uniref:C2 domain-containing protein n=1 Tax=Ladona fulva TaxID=123851 RepID=A0A8K0KBS8_LADFU|nr:hypothetical protein J437_LFUL010260 [Ladona fulva]